MNEEYSGMIAVVRNATEQGLVVHLATRSTCAEHLERGDDKATEPLAAPAPALAPDPTDIQRRCWTITNAGEGTAQCWLYNGHDGEHQWAAYGKES